MCWGQEQGGIGVGCNQEGIAVIQERDDDDLDQYSSHEDKVISLWLLR